MYNNLLEFNGLTLKEFSHKDIEHIVQQMIDKNLTVLFLQSLSNCVQWNANVIDEKFL